ncbi:MAG: HDOD domain-containing protein [Pseudomonadota bacterium]
MNATADDQFRFINLLALELNNGDITLPSLPDVVIKIRNMLENDSSDFDQISKAVSVDPVLVSKLFLFANSALYNRAGVTIDTLDGAIGRLGFEVVRNTAMSIAMEQLYAAEKHSHAKKYLQAAWARGMKLSSMGWAVSRCNKKLNDESAFLAGLMHDVGTLYIITKTDEFPSLLGDQASFNDIVQQWNPQIGKSIVESWGFNEEMSQSADVASYMADSDNGAEDPRLVDAMYVSELLVDDKEESLDFSEIPAARRLGINKDTIGSVLENYRNKLQTMQASLA